MAITSAEGLLFASSALLEAVSFASAEQLEALSHWCMVCTCEPHHYGVAAVFAKVISEVIIIAAAQQFF
jgi:hypothetical protein